MKVLIYLPVFNDEIRIIRAIKSIMNQTFTDWKLIISDNQSSDDTLASIWPHTIDPRVRVVSQVTHLAVENHFNYLENIISDYREFNLVCFISSDDYWGDEHYLENLVSNFLEKNGGAGIKLVLPIFSKISNAPECKPRQIQLKFVDGFYLIRTVQLFRNWGTVNLFYGLYEKDFLIEIMTQRFSRITAANPFTDWWWAYYVLKKTAPVLCYSAVYFKDDFKINHKIEISRIGNLKLTMRFISDMFKDKLLLIRFKNFHDFLLIFIFALTKTFFDLLRITRRTIKRILTV